MKQLMIRWCGPSFFLAAVATAAYCLFSPNPLISAASNLATAMKDGDGASLYNASITDERGCSELTPQKTRIAWNILIKPLIERSKYVGDSPIKLEANQTQAVGELRFITKQGDPWALATIANQSDEGAKTGVVYPMLATASLFDEDGHANPTLTSSMAVAGIHRYRRQLEGAGITRIMLAPGSCVSWDDLERKLTR